MSTCEHGRVSATRLLTLDDVPVLAELLRVNRDFLAPWDLIRSDNYFTADGRRAVIGDALARHDQGSALPHVILDDSGRAAGRITLNGIVRGPFQSCSLGYWVSAADNGRGLATAAVRDITGVAFEELGLHRIQAEPLLHNVASQRVLERNGFVRFGMAPAYLNIAGKWQDHIMYQVVKAGCHRGTSMRNRDRAAGHRRGDPDSPDSRRSERLDLGSGSRYWQHGRRTRTSRVRGKARGTRSRRDRMIAECGAKPGAVEDYPFGDDVAVFKIADKMFARMSLGLPPGSISLQCDPDVAVELRAQYPAITTGYHLSKRHWITITLDGSVPDDELAGLIDASYELVMKGLTRAERNNLSTR